VHVPVAEGQGRIVITTRFGGRRDLAFQEHEETGLAFDCRLPRAEVNPAQGTRPMA